MSNEKKYSFTLQSLLDSHGNPFVIIDENYAIVGANKAYCAHYGITPDDVVGSKCHLIHHNSELPCHSYGEECPMQQVMESGDRFEVSHVHHNHENFPECVSIKGHPITDEDGKHYLGEEILPVAITSGVAEKGSMKSMEAAYIAQLLVEHKGHRREVAEILKISERTLYRKLVEYNLADIGKNS